MFPLPKSTPLQLHESCGNLCLVPEICDFCKGAKVAAPSSHFCTVTKNLPEGYGRPHPLSKEIICSLVTCGECQSLDNNSPMNVCLMHWSIKNGIKHTSTVQQQSSEGSSRKRKNDDADDSSVCHDIVEGKKCKYLCLLGFLINLP